MPTTPTPATTPRQLSTATNRAMKIILALLILLAIIIGYILFRPQQASTTSLAPAAVSITATGFSPATVSVKPGQAVVWTDTDSAPHGITASGSSFKSPQSLSQNDTYSFVFNARGTYTYHDSLNPSGFSGTVVVK